MINPVLPETAASMLRNAPQRRTPPHVVVAGFTRAICFSCHLAK